MPMTLEQFAEHLGAIASVYLPAKLRILAEQIGEDAAGRAKAKLGTQQGAVGPFPAWPDLEESTELDKQRYGWPFPSPLYRTGELRDSITYEADADTTHFTVDLYTDSEYGPAHELGRLDGTIPPRPFLAPVFHESEARYNMIIGQAMVSAIVPPSESLFSSARGGAVATMGTRETGEKLNSASSLWRSGRAAAQKMGAWKSVRGMR